MNAADLRYLASVSELAKLDVATTRLTLEARADVLSASYASAYSAGMRRIVRPRDVPELACELEAGKFAQLVGLFDDRGDVRVSVTATDLQLRSKSHQVKARLFPYDAERLPAPPADTPITVVQARALLAEAEIAAKFTAENVARPEFLGIRLISGSTQLGVQAFNGASAMFTSVIPAVGRGTGRASVIVPAQDLVLGVKLIGEGELELAIVGEGSGVVLRSPSSWFRCSTLTGAWPNLSQIMGQQERSKVIVTAEQLKAVTSAAKIFEAGPAVQILGGERGVLLRSAEAETGQYAARIEGQYRGSTWYSAEDLVLAAGIGTPLALEIAAAPGMPTVVAAGTRRVWITTRAV